VEKTNKFEIGDLVRFVDEKPGMGIVVKMSDRSLDKVSPCWVYYVQYASGLKRWEMEYGLYKIAAV
jgi:hypothetical protein